MLLSRNPDADEAYIPGKFELCVDYHDSADEKCGGKRMKLKLAISWDRISYGINFWALFANV